MVVIYLSTTENGEENVPLNQSKALLMTWPFTSNAILEQMQSREDIMVDEAQTPCATAAKKRRSIASLADIEKFVSVSSIPPMHQGRLIGGVGLPRYRARVSHTFPVHVSDGHHVDCVHHVDQAGTQERVTSNHVFLYPQSKRERRVPDSMPPFL